MGSRHTEEPTPAPARRGATAAWRWVAAVAAVVSWSPRSAGASPSTAAPTCWRPTPRATRACWTPWAGRSSAWDSSARWTPPASAARWSSTTVIRANGWNSWGIVLRQGPGLRRATPARCCLDDAGHSKELPPLRFDNGEASTWVVTHEDLIRLRPAGDHGARRHRAGRRLDHRGVNRTSGPSVDHRKPTWEGST